MKKLIIVESPAKIKTISKFLGKDYKIMSTLGHIKDLPAKKIGVTINDGIDIDYVVIEKKESVIADICKQAQKADEIYLAPDPDREGEIIAWHIEQEIEKVTDADKIHRIWFNEITKPAVTEALEHPTSVDLEKVAAQQARRVLDRWVGYEVSPVLWRKIKKGLSAGRVQSVALKLICDREEEIRNFKPKEYWSIDGIFAHKKSKFSAPLIQIGGKKIDINNEKQAKTIIEKIKKASYLIDSIQDKERKKNPYPPFMTSTLQQAAYNQLGFNVKKTMQLAQNLYEGIPLEDSQSPVALITYMRTDSLRLSDTATKAARSYIDENFGKNYLPSKAQVYVKGGGKAQDAHEAIRPIDVKITPDYVRKFIPADAAKLYDLIWKRFVACQMNPAEYAQRQVTITGGEFTFRVTGSTLIFDGYLRVYSASDDEEEEEKKIVIPKTLKEKDPVDLTDLDSKQHFTQPPPRYTEASLVKGLEKEGIGRPSTYATILNTIRTRDYTTLEKKKFHPTELGMTVTKLLTENLPKIMDVKFTAHLEEDLDKIAKGELKRDTLLKEFYKDFMKDLEIFKGEKGKHAEPTDIKCPKCKKNKLAIRISKTGSFLGCLGFPECTFTSNFKRDESGNIQLIKTEGPKLLDEICPKCKKHQLRQMVGRFGPFISCSGYPECKYIPATKANFKCPLDKKGDVVKKQWKGRVFWGCSNYPKCKFVVFGDIEETKCPDCKLPFLIKKYDKQGNLTLTCSNKECGYKKAVKQADEE
jgi:DNA topoisomerase-1